ncbi:MAG: 7-cyano-7-deazaguanine synthase QueC [Fibrobacter sp.]|nr:7-cyano-7-deazaguanine synthase QueC [Fibrobacter sp.]
MSTSSAVVAFSGGQDSTTALFWARQKFSKVVALSFDYGQRHKIELESAKKICKLYEIEHIVLPINTFNAIGGNSLTDNIAVSSEKDKTLPNSFVPGRNLIFLTYAAAWAWNRQIFDLVTGVGHTDYSGYPDCRQDTMDSLSQTISLGMDAKFKIHTPLMDLDKAQTVKLAQKLDTLKALAWSHTCYNGEFPPCGTCPACILRAQGFAQAQISDPLLHRDKYT